MTILSEVSEGLIGCDLRCDFSGQAHPVKFYTTSMCEVVFSIKSIRLSSMDWTLESFFPQFLCCSPNPQWDDIWRWGRWEVMSFTWSHKGRTCIMEFMSLKKGTGVVSLSICVYQGKDMCKNNQQKGPLQESHHAAIWSWTSNL